MSNKELKFELDQKLEDNKDYIDYITLLEYAYDSESIQGKVLEDPNPQELDEFWRESLKYLTM